MLNYISVAKLATQVVAGLGVSKIVTDIVKNNVIVTTTAQKVLVKAGSFVLGSMLFEQSSNHVERKADELVAAWHKRQETEEISTEE